MLAGADSPCGCVIGNGPEARVCGRSYAQDARINRWGGQSKHERRSGARGQGAGDAEHEEAWGAFGKQARAEESGDARKHGGAGSEGAGERMFHVKHFASWRRRAPSIVRKYRVARHGRLRAAAGRRRGAERERCCGSRGDWAQVEGASWDQGAPLKTRERRGEGREKLGPLPGEARGRARGGSGRGGLTWLR